MKPPLAWDNIAWGRVGAIIGAALVLVDGLLAKFKTARAILGGIKKGRAWVLDFLRMPTRLAVAAVFAGAVDRTR